MSNDAARAWCGLPASPPPALQCGVLVVLHIPKCGGETVSDYLYSRAPLAGWRYWIAGGPGGAKLPASGWLSLTPPKPVASWERILTEARAASRPRIVIEQHVWNGVDEAFGSPRFNETVLAPLSASLASKGCSLFLATALREPVARAFSHALMFQVPGDQYAEWVEGEGTNMQTYFVLHNRHYDRGFGVLKGFRTGDVSSVRAVSACTVPLQTATAPWQSADTHPGCCQLISRAPVGSVRSLPLGSCAARVNTRGTGTRAL
jgi:hypothetical protein